MWRLSTDADPDEIVDRPSVAAKVRGFSRRRFSMIENRSKEVTPDAEAKTRFVLIDAVGVTENLKSVSQPLERDHWGWARFIEVAHVVGGLTKNPERENMRFRAPYLRVANVQMAALNFLRSPRRRGRRGKATRRGGG
jgi:hypothetical protein